ncbi:MULTISPECIES: GntR family transcriptional regulator [Rhizobium/Agrobacterium group]|uniref:GntR family transcriptional regulator n=1 Tax=Rhizobium/Agrobacterium group TaxID=227290 RepID=UPI000B3F7D1D|nr:MULTISPECIES: GntR family transcriptional regulator [Rhizobium/Agrobacterium group]MCF1482430.1 GntR family transcriptional regulator [Allorhizobium ampelinum]NSZ43929.1 GntR family transcriptional regulator [Agrobacterium vitis]NTA27677.1 GntR family transcriptional regulator [Allorhizobium ampelinum]OVE94025.1 GntR family transcriptional regulator [Allorhizobium ampelinum]
MIDTVNVRTLDVQRQPSVTEQVFELLYRQVVELELPPGAKLSEVDVAKQMGVSRQPVRDAFYRLSQQGFLMIRPQRATVVTHISERGVLQARFIRTALEMETVRAAAERLSEEQIAALDELVQRQIKAMDAGDKMLFHELDDEFHRQICKMSGHEFAWALIRDSKAHMDRIRYLSLAFGAQSAIDDHIEIMAALKARDGDRAAANMRVHLSRILSIISRIRESHGQYFATE